jgi:hypothetical protein
MTVVNDNLEEIVKIADEARSRKLVAEAVRTAYALGKYEAIIELTRHQIEAMKRARQAQELNS